MSDLFFWKAGGIFLGLVLVLMILKRLVLFYCATDHFKKSFARGMNVFTKNYNAALGKHKETLFSQLRAHAEKVSGDVLEIGAGTGANLEYLPGVSLIALEPNVHMEKIFRENVEKYPHVNLKKYIVGKAEDMKDVDDNSVSAVFCTITLCSVPSQLIERTLQEIKRVLKPGGHFYYLEHIAGDENVMVKPKMHPCKHSLIQPEANGLYCEPGTFTHRLQTLVLWTGLWQAFLDGCYCDRQPWHCLHKAGFKAVSYQKFYVTPKDKWSLISRVISPHLIGYAETFE